MSGVADPQAEDYFPQLLPNGVGGGLQFTPDEVATKGVVTIPVSFAAAGVGTYKHYFPMKVTINKIRSVVTTALSATDVGTITPSNSVGAMTAGVVTIAASAALGEEDSSTPTANNVIAADSYIQLVTAKSTAGGTATVSIEYTVTK